MNRRVMLACVASGLAIAGLWLLTSGIARATAPPLALRPALPSPPGAVLTSTASITPTTGITPTANVTPTAGMTATASLTPTLRLVGPDDEALSSPLVHYALVSDHRWQYLLYVHNPLTSPVTIVAELLNVTADTGVPAPATLGLSPGIQPAAGDETKTFSLSLVEGWLPERTYTGTLSFSVTDADVEPVTEQFVLLVSPWPAELEWAQDEFVYEVDAEHTEGTVWAVARREDATDIQVELITLRAGDGVTKTFRTVDFLSIQSPDHLKQGDVTPLALNFTFTATQLPAPGTYKGVLRLRASNAAPITASLTLVIPEDRARGPYRLEVAELGRTPSISPSIENSLTFSTALQFSGVRWLPGSTSVVGNWWPIMVGALLLGVGLAALVGYTAWALVGHRPTQDKSWLEEKVQRTWLARVKQSAKRWFGYDLTGRRLDIARLMVAVGLVGVSAIVMLAIVFSLLQLSSLAQAQVGERTLIIWEAEGRGPVRDITVVGGEVTSEVGDTGEINIGQYRGVITAGHVLTVPVTGIQHLSQPGVYQGRVLIQSPDIADGVLEVPVQVTVHDFILWPVLVIMLGVILGGYVKYQQEIASQRLEKRRDIEIVWQEWDDYMFHDRYLYLKRDGGAVSINPIYADVRHELDGTLKLLAESPEWGTADADLTVKRVRERLTKYQRLSEAVASWRDVLLAEASEAGTELLESIGGKWIEGAERTLREGNLQGATILVGKLIRDVLPGGIRGLRKQVDEISTDEQDAEKKKAIEEKKKTIQSLLNEAGDLCKKGIYGEAWLKFREAEYQLRAVGKVVPPFVKLWELSKPEPAPREEALAPCGEHYEIQPVIASDQYLTGDTVQLEVVLLDESGERKDLPEGVTCKWRATRPDDSEANDVKFKPEDGISTKATFYAEGRRTVQATILKDGEEPSEPGPSPLPFEIKPSFFKIRLPLPNVRYHAEETIPLELVREDESGKMEMLPAEVECSWSATLLPNTAATYHFSKEGTHTTVMFHEAGAWTVKAVVKKHEVDLGSPEHLFPIKPSAIVMIYQDKRRHTFNRRLAALLLALVGGMAAKRVFGLTFGSFEEYLGVFGWGVGVSLGIDPVANASQKLSGLVQGVFSRLEGNGQGQAEEPENPDE